MGKQLIIDKDNAVKAFNEAEPGLKKVLSTLFGKEVLCQNPLEWVSSFADICQAAGEDEAQYIIPASATYKLAMDICQDKVDLIAKVLNGDWVEDLADTSQRKHYPYFNIIVDKAAPGGFRLSFDVSAYDFDFSHFGVRPTYRDGKTSDFAGRTFVAEYQAFGQYQKLYRSNK